MATNAIGAGTRNLPINAPQDWWAAMSREAMSMGKSTGELVRELCEQAARIKMPSLAQQLEEAKREHMRLKHGVVCLFVGMLCVAASMFGGLDMRRTARVRTNARTGRVQEVEV